MEVQFFGVRGSIAVSGSRIGGNTACVEVTSHGHRLILDAGTGIRALGELMMREGSSRKATLLFSHFHWDHVQGFPFFTPAYLPTTELTVYGPGTDGAQQAQRVLAKQMEPPHFPVMLSTMRSRMSFASAMHGQTLELGLFRVTPFEVPCLDAQYTLDEYEGRAGMPKKGWGHSTTVEAAKVARMMDARRLLLFHHDPSHSDSKVDQMTEETRDLFFATEAAHEGQRLFLGPGSPFGYSLASSTPSKQAPTQPWWQEPAPH